MKFVVHVVVVICIVSILGEVSSFSPVTTNIQCMIRKPSFVLLAKVKKVAGAGAGAGAKNNKNNNNKNNKKQGFGVASTTTTTTTTTTKKGPKEQNDYSAFPALEDHVSKTLVAFDGSDNNNYNNAADELPMEIYERLAGIYGFRSFNYLDEAPELEHEGTTEKEVPVMSFQDLLTSGSSSQQEEKSSSSSFGDLLKPTSSLGTDLGSLLASATGGADEGASPTATATAAAAAVPTKHSYWPIDKLPAFDKFKVLHVDPLVLSVENFFTPQECDHYVAVSQAPPKNFDSPLQSRSRTVGKDSQAQAQRTSTTWYHHYKGVPELMAKAARLFGVDDIHRFEEPQTVRYRRSEKFTWHLDALAPGGDALAKAGQRTATLLVYLTDLTEEEGGATMFRDLGGPDGPLKVRPQKGSALVFFPAAGGIEGKPLDIRTLHCGEAVSEQSNQDKWIAQLWLREFPYQPTAPPGNTHDKAFEAISNYCKKNNNNMPLI